MQATLGIRTLSFPRTFWSTSVRDWRRGLGSSSRTCLTLVPPTWRDNGGNTDKPVCCFGYSRGTTWESGVSPTFVPGGIKAMSMFQTWSELVSSRNKPLNMQHYQVILSSLKNMVPKWENCWTTCTGMNSGSLYCAVLLQFWTHPPATDLLWKQQKAKVW